MEEVALPSCLLTGGSKQANVLEGFDWPQTILSGWELVLVTSVTSLVASRVCKFMIGPCPHRRFYDEKRDASHEVNCSNLLKKIENNRHCAFYVLLLFLPHRRRKKRI